MKRIIKYITRSWADVGESPHPKLRFMPPIFFDLLAVMVVIGILGYIIRWLLGEKWFEN